MLIFATLSFLQMLVSARGATASKAVCRAEWMTPPVPQAMTHRRSFDAGPRRQRDLKRRSTSRRHVNAD